MGHSTVPQGVGIGSSSSSGSHMGAYLRNEQEDLGVVPMPLPPRALLSQVPIETDTCLGTRLGWGTRKCLGRALFSEQPSLGLGM